MGSVKKVLRVLYKVVIGIVAFLAIYLFTVFALSRITVNGTDKDTAKEVTIYIKSNGVHTDIVVPVRNNLKDWAPQLGTKYASNTKFPYVGFGWGDKGFYLNTPQWSDLKVSTACNAAFYLGTSAMHTTYFGQLTEGSNCVKLSISAAEYKKLIAYIESGFQLDKDNKAVLIPNASYGDHDSFYEANGRYSLFYTCNSWANNALRASGQKAALWTLTDTGILCHYR